MNEIDFMRNQFSYQSDLQHEAAEQQNRMYAPQLREQLAETQAAVIAQTNPIKALKVLVEGLRGNIINEDNEIEKIGEPVMNQTGISEISTKLIPFISDPIRFGHISGTEVRLLALQIVQDLTVEIGIRWREFGIKDPSAKDIVVDSLMTLVFITLTRSEGGNEKNFLSRVILESVGGNKKSSKEGSIWEKLKL